MINKNINTYYTLFKLFVNVFIITHSIPFEKYQFFELKIILN